MKKLIILTLLLWSNQIDAQTVILEQLIAKSENIFKAKVEKVRVGTSNAEGTSFSLQVKVEKFYKGAEGFETLRFGIQKLDVIDLELDTMIMDYSFQIQKDSTYIFFTKKIYPHQKYPDKAGSTNFVEEKIEGVYYSKGLEVKIENLIHRQHELIEKDHSVSILDQMRLQSETIIKGKVIDVKRKKKKYIIVAKTKEGLKRIVNTNEFCVCREGMIMIGNEYIFYGNKKGAKQIELTDEWLSIIQASEYDKIKFE